MLYVLNNELNTFLIARSTKNDEQESHYKAYSRIRATLRSLFSIIPFFQQGSEYCTFYCRDTLFNLFDGRTGKMSITH